MFIFEDPVSSRASIKFALGDASKVKWSKMKPHATAVMDERLSAWSERDEIIYDQNRWESPKVTPELQDVIEQARLKLSREQGGGTMRAKHVWSASIGAQWFKSCASLDQLLASQAFLLSTLVLALAVNFLLLVTVSWLNSR